MHLDARDRHILYEIDYGVRQMASAIARKVKLPKQVVGYRIRRLQETGAIKGFRAVIDAHRLGYFIYRVYLRFKNVDPETENALCEKLSRLKNVGWLMQTTGGWDIEVIFVARNNVHFSKLLMEMKGLMGAHLREYVVSPSVAFNHFRRRYLAEGGGGEAIMAQSVIEPRVHQIDEKDFAILRRLSSDASASYRDIASRVGLTDTAVKKRMKKLELHGIIQSYRVWLDPEKLGRSYYKALITVSNFGEKLQKGMISFCMAEPAVIYLVACTGSWDVELEAECRGEEEFRALLMRFRNRFKEELGDYEILKVYNERRMDYFPFESYSDFTHRYEARWLV